VERVFADTDIILDLLSGRQPHYNYAAELFSLADEGSVKIYVSALSFANVNYILSKEFTADQSRKQLLKFKTLVSVLAVNDKIIELALASDFKDFEDGVQYYTSIENNIRTIITRNLRDFKKAEIPVLNPEQYLKSRE
jgi:predicted nucleic acid-binding protein